MKSMPLWSLVVAHFAQHWGFITLLTNIPNYMNNVLNFNIQSVSILKPLIMKFTHYYGARVCHIERILVGAAVFFYVHHDHRDRPNHRLY